MYESKQRQHDLRITTVGLKAEGRCRIWPNLMEANDVTGMRWEKDHSLEGHRMKGEGGQAKPKSEQRTGNGSSLGVGESTACHVHGASLNCFTHVLLLACSSQMGVNGLITTWESWMCISEFELKSSGKLLWSAVPSYPGHAVWGRFV